MNSYTDRVYFEGMLSAIGVVHPKMYEVVKKDPVLVVEQVPEPWKPKDKNDECPF